MGYDSTNFLPVSISKKQIIDFIKLLGYEGRGQAYYFFKQDDYKYLYGVGLNIRKESDKWLIHTRTPIYCSGYDLAYQNYTIRQIRRRFGGSFMTDEGTNIYFQEDNVKLRGAESGCYFAYFRLSNLFSYIQGLITDYNEDENRQHGAELFGIPSSTALLANITTTYIASIIENYFRELYIALLTYSEKKESIFKNARLDSADLVDVSTQKITIEEAVALSFSFQNINRINNTFQTLDKNIQIYAILSKPYRKRNETLFLTLDRLLEHRHALVHRLSIDNSYSKEDIQRDIRSVEIALKRVYQHICNVYNWHDMS